MLTPQGFIVCKGTSGMGNRILAATTALLYGEITNRKVVIDWRDGSYAKEGEENAFPAYFDCPNVYATDALPQTDAVHPELWKGNLDRTFGSLKADLGLTGYDDMSIDVSRTDYPEELLIFCSYTHQVKSLRGLFLNQWKPLSKMSTAEVIRSVLKSKLHLVDHIQQLVQSYQSQHFSDEMIGVHVRYTDIRVPLETILDSVQTLVNQGQNPKIFLATDAETVITQFNQRFDQVITTSKWFPEEGQRLHQNWGNCPDRYQNGVEALTDMYLLARCDRLVFSSKSSFGYVASLLSEAKERDLHDIAVDKSFLRRLKNKSKRILSNLALAS